MSKWEKRLTAFVAENIGLLAFFVAMAVSFLLRYSLIENEGGDITQFFLPWSALFETDGYQALGHVGIYSVPLQLLLWLETAVPMETALAIKLVSIFFDYVMAFAVAWIVVILKADASAREKRRFFMIAYALAVLLPLPILNSAYWGQSESIYACFALFAVAFLLREKYLPAFLLYGLALSIKLQSILLFPLFVILYFVNKKFSLWHFLLIPLTWFFTTLPAIFAGAEWNIGFEIYFDQTKYDQAFFINYPGLSAFAKYGWHEFLNTAAILLALLICFFMLAWLLYKKMWFDTPNILLLAIWSVLACVLFLPGMHERYAYVAEILLWAYFLYCPGKRTLVWAAVFTFSGYAAYASYLFAQWTLPAEILVLGNFAVFLHLTYSMLHALPTGALTKTEKATIA